ncbi:RNA-binding protein 1 isoform X2 [Daphnia magna]|uniref:RRM domain-containing protein n=1 Tax=Daphnia magna TaxID=35525 RepID=A0ABQ9Z879_9CRUS|nr:RNA-binding protein 1 isoform X2 [Daphnia magna]XP_057376075.1 RNA-binding protein 1-like isoform X2 [Daphnia carinata]KAK4009103.1 hypothetical protein OUZ56_014239 [Daphnia magna]
MSRHREWDLKCKVYVGNLGNNTARGDLEASFSKYGALKNVWVARNPPGFAFVEYEDPRDAEDAVRAMDGSRICGSRVRVEMSSGRARERNGPRGGGGGGDRGGDRSRGGPRGGADFRGRSRSPVRRRPTRSPSRSPPPRRRASRSFSRERRYY